jgi:hypothetical protein
VTYRDLRGQRKTERRPSPWQLLRARMASEKAAKQSGQAGGLDKKISQGPPPRSRISREAWREWHLYGLIGCPADKRSACKRRACGIGASCRAMEALGLAGDGSPLPRRARPMCGARNRQGKPCAVRVEPGKRRCRFHGGLSTGPRTAKGKCASRRRSGEDGRWWLCASDPCLVRSLCACDRQQDGRRRFPSGCEVASCRVQSG